ncbi:MAG: leucine-rich repeat domain-containing protein [Candidatus Kapabacteria bacterium]|jgi:tetratricopeptide (TPR) repeat protein|nr:leucine-rich repeat domain-containing protein [Candidatus Kapabacteria bacterium]
MKKYILLILIIGTALFASESSNLDLAIRNIKLGNTYREGKDFDNAAKYINEGLLSAGKVNSFQGRYWTAAAYESLGYLYRDMGMVSEAKDNFLHAAEIYEKIIKQVDGSQAAMIKVLNSIEGLNSQSPDLGSTVTKAANPIAVHVKQKLKELPDDLPANLRSLILKDNKFNEFPEGITNFSELEYLDLSENKVKNISENIGKLSKMHYLDLSNNKIVKLPDAITKLQNLRELNLEGNKMKDVNFNLCSLKNLRLLNLRNNKLDFQEVLKLVRCMPNTNIIFDKYVEEPEEEAETGLEE